MANSPKSYSDVRGFPAGHGRRGNLYIISGPSGAGKGTLIACLVEKVPDLQYSISCTTRPARPGEIEGKDYYFVSEDQFVRAIDSGGFLEWAQLYGFYYGTPASKVEEALAAGRSIILEIDVQGARQIRRNVREAIAIFIEPPSLAELERRLRERGREDDEELERRLLLAKQELPAATEYDYVVINDEIDRAQTELLAIIERCEANR